MSKILEFREAVDFLGGDKPFSISFGLADTRKNCMESAAKVYKRLLLQNPDHNMLHFDTLSLLARGKDGKLNKEKARALVRLFHPDKNGDITLLEFLKTCDRIYKRLRMFRATVVNSNQLDDALETILNIFFYMFIVCLILAIYAIDPTSVFLLAVTITGPISFAIGSASSKWFEVKFNVTAFCVLIDFHCLKYIHPSFFSFFANVKTGRLVCSCEKTI